MANEHESSKMKNLEILRHKENMEVDMLKQQECTELQESLRKQLSLIYESLNRIKQNEILEEQQKG